ncbi:MAG: sulfite exporter TauE/SafE family protein, partial [Oscillospiraceae bacterium]|nr:sulfite exporter TauE/SafE family protein [Oscillospiraceae bacterium]
MINGFVGTGGGIILYFVLKFLQKNKKNNDNNNTDSSQNTDSVMKNIMATTVSAVIPMSVISSAVYMIKGRVIYKELLTYLPAALIGGIIGALLLDKLKFKI